MKPLFRLVLALCIAMAALHAQSITNYTFSYSTGSYNSIYGQSGTQTATLYSGSADDGNYNLVPIGFDFVYMGQIYNQVSASTNGIMTLGQYASTSFSNNLNSGTPRPIIAPLWDDLHMGSGAVVYRTDGNAPNRVFTIEWYNVRWYYSVTDPTISFQVKLYEGTGVIEFIYRQESGSLSGTSETASIGITAAGTGSGNFLSVNSTFNAVSSTSETTNINTRPATGYTMTFSPPTPAAPSNLTFTNVLPAQMTLNWQDNSNNEVGFLIMRSTDGTNYSVVTVTAANATSYTATGLTPSTTYYWRIYAFTEGGVSSPLSGTQATSDPLLCGTRQIPSTNYPTIKAAIDSIYALGVACPVVFELQSSYSSANEPGFPLVFNGAIPGASSTNTVTFRPASGVSNVVIGANSSTVVLDLNGVSFVNFDGRPGGTGTAKALTIANVSTSTTLGTVRIYNGATDNTFRYCRILGASASTASAIV
jgi:hypothetical protein